jgi:hypothetical protein
MAGQPTEPSAILSFLNYLRENHHAYYESCEELASVITAAFGIGVVDTHPVFRAPVGASATDEDYELDVMDMNDAISAWTQYELTKDAGPFYRFMAGEADATRTKSARRVARSFANVKPTLDAFFRMPSIFVDLGDPNTEHKELNAKTHTLLSVIAPDTPTIDDAFVLTTIKNNKGQSVLAIKEEGRGEATPLFFDKQNRDLTKSGLNTVHVTNFSGMKSDGASATPTGFLKSARNKTHYVAFFNGGDPAGYSAYVTAERDIAGRFPELLHIAVNAESGEISFLDCKDILDTDRFPVSSELFDLVGEHNTLWRAHHSAKLQWEYLDVYKGAAGGPTEDWVKLRFIVDLVLLDMSRFGWAPCWSTPANTPPKREDGKAHEFKNDLFEFNPVSTADPASSEYTSVSSQMKSQWACTKFMHGNTFRRLRRRQFLRSVMGLENDSRVRKSSAMNDPEFASWVNATDVDYDAEKEVFLRSIQRYTTDSVNDIPALCVCFTATQIRLREGLLRPFRGQSGQVNQTIGQWIGENLLSGTTFQVTDTMRRFKFLAFKAISVPAHETLKRSVVGWMEDCTKIGTLMKNRMSATALIVGKVATDRKQLVNAFISHATDKVVRLQSLPDSVDAQKQGPVSLISTGLPCAAAVYSYDDPCLCARVRIRLPNEKDRAAVLAKLKMRKRSDYISSDDAMKLLRAWEQAKNSPSERSFLSDRSNRVKIGRFVDIYYDGLVPTRWSAIETVFKRIHVKWRSDGSLTQSKIQEFVCDSALNRVLSDALKDGALSGVLSQQLREAERKQSASLDSLGTKSPLVFADPDIDTDIFMLAEIDISRISNVSRRMDGSPLYVPADVEIDQAVHLLQRSCPRHQNPSDAVQDAFKTETGAQELVVTRLDWWVGSATPGGVESYEKAITVVPVVPYRFVEAQLNRHDADLSGSLAQNTAATPFEYASHAVDSMEEAILGVEATLSQFSGIQSRRAYQDASVLTQVFSDERFLELSPMQSLGRVCRIAFELLKGNASYEDENDGKRKPTSYDRIAPGYIGENSYTDTMDFVPWQYLNTPGRMGGKRAANASATNHLDALLVPYQHAPLQNANEERSIDIPYSNTDILSGPEYAIGVFRMLQLRISNASYAMNSLRMVYQNADSLTFHRRNFELASQDAACYSTEISERVMSDKTSESARLVAENLFPKAFELGRNRQDIINGVTKATVADVKALREYRKMATLYMATTVTNLKAMQFDITRPTEDARPLMLRQIMSEMSSIAEGIRYARPFLRYMTSASKVLARMKRGYATRYRHAQNATIVLASQTQPTLEEFAANHAKFEDGVRSYADIVSIGVSDVESLKRRFLDAYDTVRAFRRDYDRGAHGLLVYLTNEFFQSAATGTLGKDTSTLVQTLFASMERMMTSSMFLANREQIEAQLDLETTLQSMFPNIDAYTVVAARMHVNGMLGCVTSAAPFRDVPSQKNDPSYQRSIRESKGFDSMDGYIDESGRIVKFHCMLPTAEDVFDRGEPEECRNFADPTAQADRKESSSSSGGVPEDRYLSRAAKGKGVVDLEQTDAEKTRQEMEADDDYDVEEEGYGFGGDRADELW